MRDPLWPMFDLVVRVGSVEMRPPDDSDQRALAALLPDDVELDPAAAGFPDLSDATERAVVVRQTFWRAAGTWSMKSWALHFGVRVDDQLVGEQVLEGKNFPALRTVDSASWLTADARGQGLGKVMRRAALALAFGPLDALAASSSAWQDNDASLGVSRALGYRPNGEHIQVRGDGLDTMVHVRLTRADWLAGGHCADVVIEGFEPCRPFFGV